MQNCQQTRGDEMLSLPPEQHTASLQPATLGEPHLLLALLLQDVLALMIMHTSSSPFPCGAQIAGAAADEAPPPQHPPPSPAIE
jgi:hypothetical protein